MLHSSNSRRSLQLIQRRLFILLLRAFTLVVVLVMVCIFSLAGLFIGRAANNDPWFRFPLATALETYYLAQGGWQGVEVLFADQSIASLPALPAHWQNFLLVDANGLALATHGRADPARRGSLYQAQAGDEPIDLYVNGVLVGKLIIETAQFSSAWWAAQRLLQPVIFLSIFPAVLTLIIGMLLMRRVVTPLAEVIAAAQAVAAGDLSARVTVRGPDDLRALTDSFNQMTSALERSARERRNMLADIAHELRTPLTVIRGRLEGIVDGIYAPDEGHIAPVLEETYLLERLVEDLRLLTLAEARQLHFERRPLALVDLAQRAAGLFEAEAAEKAIALTVEAGQVGMVAADPQRVEQVIGNLVSNALRYTPAGGSVTIQVTQTPSGVELRVSDSGPGAPEEDLPHIFDRFWRGEKSRSRAGGGAGLGLAIARQLIEAQRGAVFAQNRPQGGLTVGFFLPLD